MIEGHLYDWENARTLERQHRDVAFYCARLAGRGPVIELGCGTGRVTHPLAATGLAMTGLDLSADRLAVAAAKHPSTIRFVTADMADAAAYGAPGTYGAAIVPYSSFLLLPDDASRIATLTAIERSLRPGGIAIVDLSPNFLSHAVKPETLMLTGWCEPLCAEIEYFEATSQDFQRQRTHLRKRYRLSPRHGAPSEFTTSETWHTLKVNEMRWLVTTTPLRIIEIAGTYEGDPLFDGADWSARAYKHIYVLQRG